MYLDRTLQSADFNDFECLVSNTQKTKLPVQ